MVNTLKVLKEIRGALEESNALNVNWSSDAEPSTLEYYSEYKEVIRMSDKAIKQIDKLIKRHLKAKEA